MHRLFRFLSRFMPWIDQAAWDRDRATTSRVLAAADRTLQDDPIRLAYRRYAQRMHR